MKAPKYTSRAGRLWNVFLGTNRMLAVFVAVASAAVLTTDLGARASENADDSSAASPAIGHSQPSAATVSEKALGDYRLSPGDRLTLVVYDQPQLSGEFIIDGGGGILLPLIGSLQLKGLTLAEAQQLIQQRFADGVLVQPAVSVGIKEFRPIFVTGSVRKPGSYPFIIGQSVKAAIAAAGGEGEPLEGSFNGAMSDFITAEHRVRELEGIQAMLLVRKARLEAQRDGHENFVMPMRVGLGRRNADFDLAYSSENDTLSRLADLYRTQIQTLQSQRPRIDAEISAVTNHIAKQNERLAIVNSRLADLELLFGKGLLRKDVLLNQQIEKSLVEGQVSSLEAQVAHLRQTMGDLDVRLGDVKANYLRQVVTELQSTTQRLREVETSLGPARRLLRVKAQGANGDIDDSEYTIRVSRVGDGGMTTLDATDETMLAPGDVVQVKLKRPVSDGEPSLSTQAMRELDPELDPTSSIAEGSQATSR
jgi:polysaccharide export outer membrane protein